MPKPLTLAQLAAEWECTLATARRRVNAMCDNELACRQGNYYHLLIQRRDMVESTRHPGTRWWVVGFEGWRWLLLSWPGRGTGPRRPWVYRVPDRIELPARVGERVGVDKK